jgi:Phage related hypothetical protein (DUF1799)
MLYTAPPAPDNLAVWGLKPEDFDTPNDVLEIWPENWLAVDFFSAVGGGAWNVGPGGPLGIRPEAFREIRLALGITPSQWRTIWPDVVVMEAEALATMKGQVK